MRVYELFINDEMKDGLDAISVVGSPALVIFANTSSPYASI